MITLSTPTAIRGSSTIWVDAMRSKKSDDDDDTSDDDDNGGGFSNGKKIIVKDTGEAPMVKQDLNGHDMGSKKKTTEFERDRFFVDKTDTEKIENKTLVQGSLTSSTFIYKEFGGGLFAGLTAGNHACAPASKAPRILRALVAAQGAAGAV